MSDETDRDAERNAALASLEAALGYRFKDPSRLETALRHASYANETGEGESNERLEFLGDAVLAVVVAHALYDANPTWREGELSRALHALVEGRSLDDLARRLGVGPALALGRTERLSGGESKPSILENAVEAIVGAIYLDGGLPGAAAFIEGAFAEALAGGSVPVERDPKTALQERIMADEGEFPAYRVVRDSELDGDEDRFTVEVVLRGEPLAQGVGRTKRAAEREAAATALGRWIARSEKRDDPEAGDGVRVDG